MDISSQSSRLNSAQVSQVLAMLAPIVMGYLGKEKSSRGLDAVGLTRRSIQEIIKNK